MRNSMIPVGYRPIRITRNNPTMSRRALVAWFVACLALFCLAEYYYPSL
jgi:hypothetical protein